MCLSKPSVPTYRSSALTILQKWTDGTRRRRWSRPPYPKCFLAISLIPLQEYGGYITDITRTWPISGTFTPAQKDLYNAILTTQRQCISLCRGNANVSLDGLHNIAEKALKDQLQQLGFDMSGNVYLPPIHPLSVPQNSNATQALETLFPHHLGHYIGLDVHDTPGQSRKTKLQPRQCVTIEP